MSATADQLLEQIPPSQLPFFERYLQDIADGKASDLDKYCRFPVSIEEFITSPDFLNKPDTVYPPVLEELRTINAPSKYYEVLLTGAIGAAKTFVAVYSTAYQLYLLSCLKDPHKEFGLDPASEILFISQNKTEKLAKQNAYDTLRALIASAPYFQNHFLFDRKIKSKLVFPNRIEVVPLSGEATAALGQNVIGGIIDELNFMDRTQRSRRSLDGNTFDQAEELYNSISRRRKSRFLNNGQLPGILFLLSSRRYPGQFTDRIEGRAKTDPGVYVYDKRVWEIKPDTFSGETFSVFIGDESRQPRVLQSNDEVDPAMVLEVPVEYRAEFETDIIKTLQEIGGLSTQARFPFLRNKEAVSECFGQTDSVLTRTSVDFDRQTVSIHPRRFKYLHQPRYCHIDLAVSSDSAGICVGYVPRFEIVKRGDGQTEHLPVIHIDFTLRVTPPRDGEINFEKIRKVLYVLRDHDLPIRWVSFDSFQSTDSMQILRTNGFSTGKLSVDKTTGPYDVLKTCLYDGRLIAPTDDHCVSELLSLERDQIKGKIDHPPNGSKDVADALCGVVYGLSTRREVWTGHNVFPEHIPQSIREALDSQRSKV